jgi:hypothetical protein
MRICSGYWMRDAVIERFMPKNQPGARRVDDRRTISGILRLALCRPKARIEQPFRSGGSYRFDRRSTTILSSRQHVRTSENRASLEGQNSDLELKIPLFSSN